MAKDNPLDRAEEHLKESESAGIIYNSPEARASAKLALAESFQTQDRQDAIGSASAASEGGDTLAGGGGGQSLEAIESRLNTLRQGQRTNESMAEIKKLNSQKDSITGGPDVDDVYALMTQRR